MFYANKHTRFLRIGLLVTVNSHAHLIITFWFDVMILEYAYTANSHMIEPLETEEKKELDHIYYDFPCFRKHSWSMFAPYHS